MTFGRWLRTRRLNANFEAWRVASQADISRSYLSDIELDRRAAPPTATIVLLCSILGADIDVALVRAGRLPFGCEAVGHSDQVIASACAAFRAHLALPPKDRP